ncbi:folliculin-interacting protein 2 isoform X2 [Homalodisca vitripennis]|uniref:folliculin-interacting protein 2 isoform X2 n=1 Tax=Homalodisca vitripennis TaxID=197043 RepID=UPI001EEA0579|nr:folliculin-interacting protein 2 isoform X2 [Homalodisca vitripennis]
MALFYRLFSPRKTNKKDQISVTTDEGLIKDYKPYSYHLEKNEVRVLLFRECDWRGRKLLFDSTSVEKVPFDPKNLLSRPRSNSSDMIVEVTKGYGYKYKKPHADINNLGETIFGSIAMATRGPSLKVHLMKDPVRIMFTKVIQAPRSGVRRRQISDEKTVEDSQGSSVNSMGDFYNNSSFDSKQGSFEATLNDSGFGGGRESSMMLSPDWMKRFSPQPCSCSSNCPLRPPSIPGNIEDTDGANSSNSLQSGGSLSSLRRRWARSEATTLDFADPTQPALTTGKRTKLGIAIIIPLMSSCYKEMEQFLLDRLPLVTKIVTRLQHSTELAYCRRDVFVQSMLQASINAAQSVYELVCGSRLDRPLWLTMTSDKTSSAIKSELANRLVSDLSHLLTTIDTKHTNFFISTLLTAVLTHHLGWVPTVCSDVPGQPDSALADLSRNHPYNPLWAQLSDLQGALGYPPKIAKTVVVGKSEPLVLKLLSILSYFIRCSQVRVMKLEREEQSDEENQLEYILECDQGNAPYDKDAIREFHKAGSDGGCSSTSTSTLTKSKTVLSMKTFSVTDCEMDTANSLESGFESCNDFSGDSYEDRNKHVKPIKHLNSKLGKSLSCNKLIETSFSQHLDDIDPRNATISVSPFHSSTLSVVKCLENDNKAASKLDSEKQFTSDHLLNMFNKINSRSSLHTVESSQNSFSIKNIYQSNSSDKENKENKVVFVLGENEELVNIKGQDEANLPESLVGLSEVKSNKTDFKRPLILIDFVDVKDSNKEGERCQTENKTEFYSGEVSDRVVIVHPTPIELEVRGDTKSLKMNQPGLHRCLSVPEEAVSETDWVKSRRSREASQLIRRWLSDSTIERTTYKSLCEISDSESTPSVTKDNNVLSANVFRTSDRSLKDTSTEQNVTVEQLVNKSGCEVPLDKLTDVDKQIPPSINEYIKLPSQRWLETETCGEESGVAASLYGGVSNVYNPELVLQGLTQGLPEDLQHSLQLDRDLDLAEAVCILANTDTWEVLLVSSHSLMADRGGEVGVRVGMSQLVANMLETTQQLCSLSVPAQMCLSHVETKLSELCVRSQALAELLLDSDFLNIATLTSVLDLDANDVPLLLSVASTHTPLVTRKYGLSFQ